MSKPGKPGKGLDVSKAEREEDIRDRAEEIRAMLPVAGQAKVPAVAMPTSVAPTGDRTAWLTAFGPSAVNASGVLLRPVKAAPGYYLAVSAERGVAWGVGPGGKIVDGTVTPRSPGRAAAALLAAVKASAKGKK